MTKLNDSQRLGLHHYDYGCDFLMGRSGFCTCDPRWEPTLDVDETDLLLQDISPDFGYEPLPGMSDDIPEADIRSQWAPGFYTLPNGGGRLYVNYYGSSCFSKEHSYRKVSVTLVVKADDYAEMCDGISETLRSLDPAWLLDWSYTSLEHPSFSAEAMQFDPDTYEEGDAFNA